MREVIRETNLQLVPPGVTTRFVICRPISSEADPTLWAEVHLHDDIYLVDCTENMNNGKTIDFYQHVRRDFPDHHYYFKTDMDSYVLFYNLAKVVDAAPRCLAYLGRSAWDEGMKHLGYPYMTGAIYGLSNDLVGMLESCGEACVDRQEIGEDVLMGKRVQELTNGRRHWVSFARTADYPYFHPDREPLVADPYAINTHMAKGPERWWTLHRQYTKTVTAEAIREERNFFGPNLQILEEIHCPDQAAAGAMPVLELAQEATTT